MGIVYEQSRTAGAPAAAPWRLLAYFLLLPGVAGLCGCTSLPEYLRNGFKVGPNYGTPAAPVAQDWIEIKGDAVRKDAADLSQWWTVFDDKKLDQLVCMAYRQNLPLREAAWRILEAQAQYGIAVGNIFPQTQKAVGDYFHEMQSEKTQFASVFRQRNFSQFDAGFNLAWELDFWGRLRRAVESNSALLDASVHNYDDVLVTLLSDVATNYVNLRTTEKRIEYAQENVKLEEKTVKYLRGRQKAGVALQVDLAQAEGLLYQTKATIPELEISLRMFNDQLCILLSIPPEDLRLQLKGGAIPKTPDPEKIAVGIPADLLRRRPDIRVAERQAAAQSAQIGIAEAEFYPAISITGTIGVSAAQFKDLFRPQAYVGTIGPNFQWNLLNYGRILNNVRFQDAKFQELVAAYKDKVVTAQGEVENALAMFLKARERTKWQKMSVEAAEEQAHLVQSRFEVGDLSIAQLILYQQNLVQQQDTLAVAQGEIALGLIALYKALGGGWEIRHTGCDPDAGSMTIGPPDSEPPVPAPRKACGFGHPY